MTDVRVGRILVGLGLACALGSGCDEKLATVAGPSPNLTATLSSIQREIFQSTDAGGRSACVQCHNAQASRFVNPTGLVLTADVAFNHLVSRVSFGRPGQPLVLPGDPEGSYLIHKIDGRSGITGVRMPTNGPPFLTDGQILIIKRWIQLGARND